MRELVTELALGLQEHVLPYLGAHAGRAHIRAGAGGDVTFAIDTEAETFLERFLAERAPDVAFYSEDRGLVLPDLPSRPSLTPPPDLPSRTQPHDLLADRATYVLIVDPIDGTRPALAGFESACVSVAAAPLGAGKPTMGDVEVGAVVEIKSGTIFTAERGRGVAVQRPDGALGSTALSDTEELEKMFWTLGFRGRPAVPLATVLEELIDVSSVGGAVFDLGSATYDLTRLVTGQLDAYVDVGTRIIEEAPRLRARFEAVGGGAVLNNSPYDLAAAALCVEEAGATVTDAHGRPLADRPLLGSGHEYQMSCVAAANPGLHASILEALERGFRRLRRKRWNNSRRVRLSVGWSRA
jgi:myo-inositol-1(or 4)-monophosphatase